MSTNIVKKFVKEFKPIEIKEPFKSDVIEFNNTDDFTKYYREHEDDFNNISTYKLNVKYKIPGYKISKKGKKTGDKSEIILVKDYHYIPPITCEVSSTNEVSALMNTINQLEKRISNIENYLASE